MDVVKQVDLSVMEKRTSCQWLWECLCRYLKVTSEWLLVLTAATRLLCHQCTPRSPTQDLEHPSGGQSIDLSLASAAQEGWAMRWVGGPQLPWLCLAPLIPTPSLLSCFPVAQA